MKKRWSFCAVCAIALCLAGCSKFEPTESTIFIQSNGQIKSAVMESFDEPYYDFAELSADIQKETEAYCRDANNEEAVVVDSLTEGTDEVTLFMTYLTAEDYAQFNQVILFAGTYAEAIAAGYEIKDLYDAEGASAQVSDEELAGLKVVVTEESLCIQTSGRIRYVSDNVTMIDNKLAKALEVGKSHPAYILYK